MRTDTRQLRATLIGGIAVLLWALLALFTTWTAGIPPFQTLAVSFAVAFGFSALLLSRRGAWGMLRQPWPVWLLGGAGCSATTPSTSPRSATHRRWKPA